MSVPLRRTRQNMDSSRPIYDMGLPFNPNGLIRNARNSGFNRHDAAVFAHLALQEVRALADKAGNGPVTSLQVAEAIKKAAAAEVEREEQLEREREEEKAEGAKEEATEPVFPRALFDDENDFNMMQEFWNMPPAIPPAEITQAEPESSRKKFKFTDDGLAKYFDNSDPYGLAKGVEKMSLKYNGRDIITALCGHVELAVELGKHLRPKDIINLYIANRAFKNSLDGYLLSSIRTWIRYNAPEAGRVFLFKLYRRHLVPDPTGRTWAEMDEKPRLLFDRTSMTEPRTIPGLKYLQLVLGRDRYCRQIVAIMARNGHRMPQSMHHTLLRLWLLMDLSTGMQRQAMLRNKALWDDQDLYNVQMFFMKLGMHFNDPVYGPGSYEILHLMMGQKGLYPLWQLLFRKKYTKLGELVKLCMRYDFEVPPDHWGNNYFESGVHGVPFDEIGIGHLEGWGEGEEHLLRPDELIPMEAVARGLELDQHLTHMMLWGHFDWKTGENLVPSLEEMYISDEEEVIGDMDTTHHWKPKHVLKKRFKHLSPQQQQEIIEDDEDDRLRAMAWCGDINDYESGSSDDDMYSLDDEIRRGFILNPQPRDQQSQVPDLADKTGWQDFVNRSIMGIVPEVGEDEALRAQAWQSYQDVECEGEWDWQKWLAQNTQCSEEDVYSGESELELRGRDGSDESDDSDDVLVGDESGEGEGECDEYSDESERELHGSDDSDTNDDTDDDDEPHAADDMDHTGGQATE